MGRALSLVRPPGVFAPVAPQRPPAVTAAKPMRTTDDATAGPVAPNAEVAGADEALAARAAAGDVSAFDALVALFSTRVFSVACRILRDRAEAEDLSQEVFVALHQALPNFRGESKLSTWIYRITRNRCLNRLKFLQRRHIGRLADVDDPALQRFVTDAHSDANPTRRLENDALAKRLEAHLLELPSEQRTLVILRDLEDLSYEEIVEVTGLPLGTVKSRLHRARMQLAKQLSPVVS